MEKYPDVTNWVAVDDMEMFDLGEDHFVHCPLPREGIKQLGIKEKIIHLLNKNYIWCNYVYSKLKFYIKNIKWTHLT